MRSRIKALGSQTVFGLGQHFQFFDLDIRYCLADLPDISFKKRVSPIDLIVSMSKIFAGKQIIDYVIIAHFDKLYQELSYVIKFNHIRNVWLGHIENPFGQEGIIMP